MSNDDDDRPEQTFTVIDGTEQDSPRRFVVREDRALPTGVAVEVSLEAFEDLDAKLADLDYAASLVERGEPAAIERHRKALHELALSAKRLSVSRAEIAMLSLQTRGPDKG